MYGKKRGVRLTDARDTAHDPSPQVVGSHGADEEERRRRREEGKLMMSGLAVNYFTLLSGRV
jgi:hypothetical protein